MKSFELKGGRNVMHNYRIKFLDDTILFFKSKHHVRNISIALRDTKSFLIFDDADVAINTNQIKKFVADGIEYKFGHYPVH